MGRTEVELNYNSLLLFRTTENCQVTSNTLASTFSFQCLFGSYYLSTDVNRCKVMSSFIPQWRSYFTVIATTVFVVCDILIRRHTVLLKLQTPRAVLVYLKQQTLRITPQIVLLHSYRVISINALSLMMKTSDF